MLFLYNFGIQLYVLAIRLSSLKSKKAAAWLNGRKNLLKRIEKEIDRNVQYTWFHFASLGEFEQGRPVLEQLKAEDPHIHILITFFSPSGYEIRKNYELADHVFYLPADTAQNASGFIRLVNPKLAIFTKYEYWYHYFKELNRQKIPLYVISGIFRKEQPFFKWYGTLHRKMLHWVSYFFVQNEESKLLLTGLGIEKVLVSGDTRFDRVAQNAQHPKEALSIRNFCGSDKVFIAGSTWPEDEKLIAGLAKPYSNWKFIIAPHEIGEDKLIALEKLLPGNSIRYSEYNSGVKESESPGNQESIAIHNTQYTILIIDNIGMLSSLYQYGHIAYIGGGFGAGIHNTLEAAAFGLPLIFGPNYHKFKEAKDLLKAGGGFSIQNYTELNTKMQALQEDKLRNSVGEIASEYVENHQGATDIILNYIRNKVSG